MIRRTFVLLACLNASAISAQTPKSSLTPAQLRQIAADFYAWRQQNFPVWSSEQGLHTWDSRLTDYSADAITKRHVYVGSTLSRVRNADISTWTLESVVKMKLRKP